MSEPNITQQENNNQPGATGENNEFTPITTQEEFNKRISARLKRQTREFETRTAELTDKAAKWDEWQEQNKTDLQKAEERVAELEKQVSDFTQKQSRAAWVAEASKEYGVPAELLRGGTEEEIKTHAESLKPYFEKQNAPFVASDGFASSGGGSKSTAQQFADAIDGLI